jgi:hypothetical protein
MTDLVWRSVIGLAGTIDPALDALHRRERLEGAEVQAVLAAITAAIPTLPTRDVPTWMRGMARVRAAGRRPAPRDFWSAMRDQLADLVDWICRHGSDGLTVERRQPVPATATGDDGSED